MWFAFVLFLTIPVFGGDVRVTFSAMSEDGCRRLHKVVLRELETMTLRYTVGDCHPVEAPLP